MAGQSAFVLGHTGRVGKYVTRALLASPDYNRVVLFGRRMIDFGDDPLYNKAEQKVIDFDNLQNHTADFEGIDVGFCCLGVRITGATEETLQRVDHDYCVNAGQVAKDAGVKQFHLLSANSADPNSRVQYTRIKGKTNEDCRLIGFERLCIYKIGHVLWKWEEMDFREKSAYVAVRVFCCCCPRRSMIPADKLANIMITNALDNEAKGVEMYSNSEIHTLLDKPEKQLLKRD